MKCAVCGYDVPEGKKYCPLCGNSMEQEPGEELMFRNTSEPERGFDPETDDTQLNWNTFDFQKPQGFRDITMDWSQADFSEAVERAAKSMDARAAQARGEKAPEEPAAANDAHQTVEDAVKDTHAVSVAELPADRAVEQNVSIVQDASIPKLVIPDFSMPDFSEGWVELVEKESAVKGSLDEVQGKAATGIKLTEDSPSEEGVSDDETSVPEAADGLVWQVPELFKEPAQEIAPERDPEDGTVRIADKRLNAGHQASETEEHGLDALFRKSTREFDFAPESFDLGSTKIYEHSAAKWTSRAEDNEGDLPHLSLFEDLDSEAGKPAFAGDEPAAEGQPVFVEDKSAADEKKPVSEEKPAAERQPSYAGESTAEDEPVSYDWLKTQVSPIRGRFFTDDLDLSENTERSPEQFFTFNRKNEEFQKLLDEEYARMMSVQADVDSVKMPPARTEESQNAIAEEPVVANAPAEPDNAVEEVEDIIEPRPELGAPSVPFSVGSDTEEIGRKLDALFGEVIRKERPAEKKQESFAPPADMMPKQEKYAGPETHSGKDEAFGQAEAPIKDKTPSGPDQEPVDTAEGEEKDDSFASAIAAVTSAAAASAAAAISGAGKELSAVPETIATEAVSGAGDALRDVAVKAAAEGDAAESAASGYIHEAFDWRTSSEIAADEAAARMREEASDAGKELSSLEDRLEKLQRELEARRVSLPQDTEKDEASGEEKASEAGNGPADADTMIKTPAEAATAVPFEMAEVSTENASEAPVEKATGLSASEFEDMNAAIDAGSDAGKEELFPEHSGRSVFDTFPGSDPDGEGPASEGSSADTGYDASGEAPEGTPAAYYGQDIAEGAAPASVGLPAEDEALPLFDTRKLSEGEQADIENSINDLFEGREEPPEPKKMNPIISLLLTLAIIAGLFEGGVFAMNSFAPQLPFTQTIVQLDEAIKNALSDTFGGFGDKLSQLFGGKSKTSEVEADGVDFKAIVSEYNKNIKSVSRNSSLAFTDTTKTSVKNLADCPVVEDADVKSAVYKTMIQYNSSWIDFVNSGDDTCLSYMKADGAAYRGAANFDRKSIDKETFNSFELGEIRSYDGGVYIFTQENLSVNKDGQTSSAVYNWIYNLEKVGDEYKVVDYASFS